MKKSNEKFKLITGSSLKIDKKPVKHIKKKKQSQSKFLILAGRKLKLQKENRWINKTKKSTSTLTQEQKESIILQAFQSSESRQTLAESLVQPIRARLDYSGFARRAFSVQPLPDGALPIYERD